MDWLQTVTELTNPMNARQAIEDADLLEALDFEPACTGTLHPQGIEGHDDGPAVVILRAGCGAETQYCQGRYDRWLLAVATGCIFCKGIHYPHEFIVTPIGGTP